MRKINSPTVAFAEEMLVHRNAIVAVPDELPLELGALLGCAVLTAR